MFGKIIAGMISGILVFSVCAITGLVIGAFIGGNYMTEFQFNGAQGYEATGQIGEMLGAAFGLIPGIIVAFAIAKRNKA